MKSDTVVTPPANAAAEPLVRSSALPFGLGGTMGSRFRCVCVSTMPGNSSMPEASISRAPGAGHKLWTDLHDFLAADSDIGLHAAVFVDDKTVTNDQLPRLLRLRRARLHHQGHRQAGYCRRAGSGGGGRSAARPRS